MPLTIDDIGLEKYLELTKPQHNDKDYADLIELSKLEVPKVKIAKAFGVSEPTITDWLKRSKEKSNA